MNFKELFEGAEPNLPGAEPGVKIMSMDQFLAQGSDGDGEEVPADMEDPEDDHDDEDDEPSGVGREKRDIDEHLTRIRKLSGLSEAASEFDNLDHAAIAAKLRKQVDRLLADGEPEDEIKRKYDAQQYHERKAKEQQGVSETASYKTPSGAMRNPHTGQLTNEPTGFDTPGDPDYYRKLRVARREKNAEYQRQARLRKAAAAQPPVDEATKLPASTRDIKGAELTDYLDRIRNREKDKGDKYKLPYIHRSSVVSYYNEEGKTYNVDAIKQALGQRPKKLLKQNEKMKHSNGEFEQFFNIGFAALVGIALDENTNELIVVNTCPGAGSCKVDCFAMKGGKVQFAGPWVSDGRILTFLLNDPDGFKAQLIKEIGKEVKDGQKGSKGFEAGWAVTVRWHDAGDFFSPEYMQLAFDIAEAFPTVKFYAYTKMASAALADKPENFIVNWSEGANTKQEKQVKAQDPELEKTKNSRIVPTRLFYDLLKKDEKKNLVKTADGAWQPASPEALKEIKQRLAKEYGLSVHSILSYDEWQAKDHDSGMKWNVIVAPGEGDVSANSHDVLSTLLLRH